MEPETNTKEGPYSPMTIAIFGGALLIVSSAIGAFIGPMFSVKGSDAAQIAIIPIAQGAQTNVVVGAPEEMRNISGTITAIKGATFTLHNEMSGFSNPSLSERIVSVTTKTEISKITQKDEKRFRLRWQIL